VATPKPIRPIAGQLAMATAAALNLPQANAQESWDVSLSVLQYQEPDRIQAVEPMLLVTHQLDEDNKLSAKLVYDSLTGASPNGAMPANQPQTFTSPSGLNQNALEEEDDDEEDDDDDEDEEEEYEGVYVAQPGEKPLDSSFEDTRTLIGLGWETRLNQDYQLKLGAEYSTETDYESVSIDSTLTRSLNRDNTEVSIGLNLEQDTIIPFGGVPHPFSDYANRRTQGTEASRNVWDFMVGIAQVHTRRWLSQFNASLSYSSGYQEDPYKILTVTNDGNLIPHPVAEETWRYAFESRPSTRTKKILYWQNKLALNNQDVLDVAARWMSDDWGISSSTLNLTLRWHLTEGWYWEPHVRYYRQSAADFYRPFLRSGVDVVTDALGMRPVVRYASADARLAAFDATTFGLKTGIRFLNNHEWTLRAESYQQHDRNQPMRVRRGSDLDGMEQFTELSAFWVHTSYRIRW
jgi:hypothetical protein